jgi:hypothetical protein
VFDNGQHLSGLRGLSHYEHAHEREEGVLPIKLDMSKAYDRVEWSFLEAMIKRLGFADQRVKLIMSCVSFVSYSVHLNGSPLDVFSPTRGLRQGDPLSPYLFLFCAESLSSLLQKACQDEKIIGVPISARGFQLRAFTVDYVKFTFG